MYYPHHRGVFILRSLSAPPPLPAPSSPSCSAARHRRTHTHTKYAAAHTLRVHSTQQHTTDSRTQQHAQHNLPNTARTTQHARPNMHNTTYIPTHIRGSENRAPYYNTPNNKILIIRIPKYSTPIFGNSHIHREKQISQSEGRTHRAACCKFTRKAAAFASTPSGAFRVSGERVKSSALLNIHLQKRVF